ncbi:TaqI-like C-terminal specificity domain-containing protein [Mucilaginibacter antarcticus]|uniref:TaqI-like C-terminal specificity domain-containing protein n=1 Tax=Mucilaginibacter antarcticus TaxID=1855725 RepID=UPI0036252851
MYKYRAEWANLYIIALHNGYTNSEGKIVPPIYIDDYPSIKEHLDKFLPQLKIRTDKGFTPYNLRSCIYMDDFFKQKIIYPNMTKFLPFYYDEHGFFTNQKCFIISGKNIGFLTAFLNSSIFKFCFKKVFQNFREGQEN